MTGSLSGVHAALEDRLTKPEHHEHECEPRFTSQRHDGRAGYGKSTSDEDEFGHEGEGADKGVISEGRTL